MIEKIWIRYAVVIGFAFLTIAAKDQAQFKPIDKESKIEFSINNFGISTAGSLTGLEGTIRYEKREPEADFFDVSVDANSINTGNSLRDSHLRDESFLNTGKFPRIRLVSDSVGKSGRPGEYRMYAKLTIKGMEKSVLIPFTEQKEGQGYRLAGTFSINRKDFNIGHSSFLSNNIEVKLNVMIRQ